MFCWRLSGHHDGEVLEFLVVGPEWSTRRAVSAHGSTFQRLWNSTGLWTVDPKLSTLSSPVGDIITLRSDDCKGHSILFTLFIDPPHALWVLPWSQWRRLFLQRLIKDPNHARMYSHIELLLLLLYRKKSLFLLAEINRFKECTTLYFSLPLFGVIH